MKRTLRCVIRVSCVRATCTCTRITSDGEKIVKCGAYTYDIPKITMDDLEKINMLLDEQHIYFMEYAV